MNVQSKIDTDDSDDSDRAEIILGEDWDERARGEAENGQSDIQRGPRGWISLNRSPLARKIITFNLLALVVLLGGVLYLNQFREGLVDQREKSLVTEARLIARVFEAGMPKAGPVNLAAGDGISPTRTLAALDQRARYTEGGVAELDYVNPETGADVLPTMGFTAKRLAAGATHRPPLRSSSAAYHVIAGRGVSVVNGERIEWGPKDTFTAPVFADITHHAAEDAYLIRVHDRPLQDKLGYYEERAR